MESDTCKSELPECSLGENKTAAWQLEAMFCAVCLQFVEFSVPKEITVALL